MTSRQKRLVYWAFGAVLGLCAVQTVLLSRVGEPYPGLMMPGFHGNSGGHGEHAISERAEAAFVLRDGSSAIFTMRELFAQFPVSHHRNLGAILAPLPEHKEPVPRDGLRYRLFPGLHAGLLDRAEPAHRESLRRWVKQRASELVPGADVQRLEINWYRDTHHFLSGERTSEPTGRYTLDLQEPVR